MHNYKGFKCEGEGKNVGLLGLQLRECFSDIEFSYVFCFVKCALYSVEGLYSISSGFNFLLDFSISYPTSTPI